MAYWSQLGLQEGMSVIMELMIYFHDYMMVLLCIIMVFVSYLFVLILSSGYTDKYIVESHFLELVWTIIPMVFLVFMAYPSLYLLYMTEDFLAPAYVLKIVGHQWYWEYEYSTTNSSSSFDSYMVSSGDVFFRCLDVDNRVCVPYNLPTIGLVTSADVLHSWTVPSLGVKADATPGRLNFLTLFPTSHGVFYGQCSELCGSNHSFMPIVVEVVDLSHFVGFLSSMDSVS